MSDALIAARQLTKDYPLRSGVWRRVTGALRAVERLDLDLWPGESLGLVGESGCGKSTVARLLTGLLVPTTGRVLFRGQPLPRVRGEAARAFHREIQMIFQHPAGSLNPRMRIEQIVEEPLRIHRLARKAALSRRIDELLEQVRLPRDFRRRKPSELSGGERQRVAIARALATQPRVLICDEPIASLDVSVGGQVLALLRELAQHHQLTLLVISHDLHAVAALCQRIAVMYLGRIVEMALTTQLLSAPWHPYTELLLRSASLDLTARVEAERPSSVLPRMAGCCFRPRCPLAEPLCDAQDPALLEKRPSRWVACHKRP